LEKKNQNIELEDILALEKAIDLIKEFSDKNPIRKYKINYELIKNKILELKNSFDEKKDDLEFDLLKHITTKLNSIIKKEIIPRVFYIFGGHGGIIIRDSGFCEFDVPNFALKRLLERMKFAIKTNTPYSLEIAISCLNSLQNRYPQDFLEFKRLFKDGHFEIINPSYSQPYSLIIGEESNIKQIEYGLTVIKKLGLECNLYYCSEASLHPQIPQILKGFNIDFCSLRTRLLGLSPSSISAHIGWVGLDDTKIDALIDQCSIFNGEYWHGTFFREIPNLLFQAVARPFMNNIVYSTIEDFIMILPLQDEIWRISKFSDIFGKFILCSDLLELLKMDGEFKFPRDAFSLGKYIFLQEELFLNNKECEVALISAEILNCVLGLYGEKSNDELFNTLWDDLLLTQAHDNYAVPFIKTGDYSAQQLPDEEYKNLIIDSERITISELSIKIQKEIQDKCKSFIKESLTKIGKNLINPIGNKNANGISLIVFNPTIYSREDITKIPVKLENSLDLVLLDENNKPVSFFYSDSTIQFISNIPSIGYKIYNLKPQRSNKTKNNYKYFYELKISNDNKSIEVMFKSEKVYDLKFETSNNYTLNLFEHNVDSIEESYIFQIKVKERISNLEIIQFNGINRLEFVLNSNFLEEILLIPKFHIRKVFINYPFGIEETKRTEIQTLDFLWLTDTNIGIAYIQKNSQRFIINRENYTIRNKINNARRHEFCISVSENSDYYSVYKYVNEYKFRLLGIPLQENYQYISKSDSFLSISTPITLINLWRREDKTYLRILNPSLESSKLDINGKLVHKAITEIDFNYNLIKKVENKNIESEPWKIQTYKI
jgi:hypothetical protein